MGCVIKRSITPVNARRSTQLKSLVCLATAAAALVFPSALRAGVLGTSLDNGDGTYTYQYSVDNTAGSFDIFAFSLEFNFASSRIDWNQLDTASGGEVSTPNLGWFAQAGTPIQGLSAQDFYDLDPADDIAIGNSLQGFSFTSRLRPGSVTYYYEFGSLGESSSGSTVGPIDFTVPEVSSSLGLLLGAAGWLVALRRRL